ncbi:hypothetical protein GEU84_009715 [Fertoebacter nigrum]|uniref:Peptidase M15 n=2 Tax=Fertoeibacter niger TaxID=2656921 RepID=A0A8X8KKV0_9RHOB|nr:hypothetical protein [Fertoeibacter niger]
MRKPATFAALEKLGRVRLSKHFVFRDFLHSEIASFHGIANIPDDPDLAIAAGTRLATDLIDPLVETFGPITIRSAYRAPAVNAFGNAHGLNCARNEASHANHIWDRRDAQGRMGACACIQIPWFADQYERGRDWRDLAWWIHDHLPYSEQFYFPIRAALNLTWREDPDRRIASYIAPRGVLLRRGEEPAETSARRRARHTDFPPFRGIRYP